MTKNRRVRRALIVILTVAVAGGTATLAALADSANAAGSQIPVTRAQGTPAASSDAPRAVPSATLHAAHTGTSAPAASTSPGTTRSASGSATNASSRTVQQVQLNAAQLPARSAEQWTASGSPSTRVIQGHDIEENECASVDGATTWTQQSFSGGGSQNVAIQDTFAFSSASAAQNADQAIVSAMGTCQQTTRALQARNKVPADGVVTQTAESGGAVAWERTWTGVMGVSAEGPQTNHLYLAVGGSTLIVLQFTEFPGAAAAYDTAGDPQVLAMLETELAR